MLKLRLLIIFVLFCIGCSFAKDKSENKPLLLEEAGCDSGGTLIFKGVCIDHDYEINKFPNQNITPAWNQGIHVAFNPKKQEVLKVIEASNRITMNIKIGLWWRDDRIKTNTSLLNIFDWRFRFAPGLTLSWYEKIQWEKYIWYPQVVNFEYSNEKKIKHNPASILHIEPGELIPETNFTKNSTVLFAYFEYELGLTCNFDFIHFPMDNQICKLRLTNEYARQLRLALFYTPDSQHTVELYEKDGFDITITYIEGDKFHSQNLSYVGINLLLKRVIHPYLYQYYIPCIVIVCVSQCSFIIPPSAIAGRLGLVATQFLTLTNIFIDSNVSIS